jgi:hypothetical protein
MNVQVRRMFYGEQTFGHRRDPVPTCHTDWLEYTCLMFAWKGLHTPHTDMHINVQKVGG